MAVAGASRSWIGGVRGSRVITTPAALLSDELLPARSGAPGSRRLSLAARAALTVGGDLHKESSFVVPCHVHAMSSNQHFILAASLLSIKMSSVSYVPTENTWPNIVQLRINKELCACRQPHITHAMPPASKLE